MELLNELNSYFSTGWIAVLEKTMIFFMVFWIAWCAKLYLEPDKDEDVEVDSSWKQDTSTNTLDQ